MMSQQKEKRIRLLMMSTNVGCIDNIFRWNVFSGQRRSSPLISFSKFLIILAYSYHIHLLTPGVLIQQKCTKPKLDKSISQLNEKVELRMICFIPFYLFELSFSIKPSICRQSDKEMEHIVFLVQL